MPLDSVYEIEAMSDFPHVMTQETPATVSQTALANLIENGLLTEPDETIVDQSRRPSGSHSIISTRLI